MMYICWSKFTLNTPWPDSVWAGGVDRVDLMERGSPEHIRAEVRRHISETDALRQGGMFVASSSEFDPPTFEPTTMNVTRYLGLIMGLSENSRELLHL